MKISPNFRVLAYEPASVLRVTGEDAHTFLQSQFTNDLGNIPAGGAVYGLWLDRKGRVLADSTVVRTPGAFMVVSTTSRAAAIAAHLGAHIVADDVAVSDETARWRGFSLLGGGSGEWMRAQAGGIAFPGRRASAENWEWIVGEDGLGAAEAALAGIPRIGAEEAERIRILDGIASVPGDIGPSDLPNEGGLDAVAISYSKGCYTGQEVMARVKSMGRVRRSLVRVRAALPPPAVPAALWRGPRKEGEIRSVAAAPGGFEGLALLLVTAAAPGTRLSLAEGGAETVEVF